ncbi:uncharacterized protein J3R85_020382 [Psidium guajava]|nr:uncharacterized protein J3R85_020382 [Psidium guajava]
MYSSLLAFTNILVTTSFCFGCTLDIIAKLRCLL